MIRLVYLLASINCMMKAYDARVGNKRLVFIVYVILSAMLILGALGD